MANNNNLNDNRLWALSEEARLAVKDLIDNFDFDPDLALALIEKMWPESRVYNLEKDED